MITPALSEPGEFFARVDNGLQHRPSVAQGRYSINVFSIYLCVTAAMFVVAALMHPGELLSLAFGLAYLLALPSGCKSNRHLSRYTLTG